MTFWELIISWHTGLSLTANCATFCVNTVKGPKLCLNLRISDFNNTCIITTSTRLRVQMYTCIIWHVDGWNWKQNNWVTQAKKRNEKWNQNLHNSQCLQKGKRYSRNRMSRQVPTTRLGLGRTDCKHSNLYMMTREDAMFLYWNNEKDYIILCFHDRHDALCNLKTFPTPLPPETFSHPAVAHCYFYAGLNKV